MRPDLPEPARTLASGGHRALHALLANGLGAAGNAQTYPFSVALRLARYLERAGEYGPALAADDLRDCRQMLGATFSSWRQAEAALDEPIRICSCSCIAITAARSSSPGRS